MGSSENGQEIKNSTDAADVLSNSIFQHIPQKLVIGFGLGSVAARKRWNVIPSLPGFSRSVN